MSISIEKYGYDDFFKEQARKFNITDDGLIPARVTEVQRKQYKIVAEYGEKRAKLKGSFFYGDKDTVYPTVGDFVFVKPNQLGDDVIYYVLDRKTKFSRLDSFYGTEQMVAANFDYVFIMTSLNYDFNLKRVERYLTITYQSGGKPVIVLTKSDLCGNISYYINQINLTAHDVPTIAISTVTGDGLGELKNYLEPHNTIVFLGSSGVGKSSLVNVLLGEEKMAVNDIRQNDSKGHHTTTYRQLILLDNESIIIDTPGMRELGMWDISEGLDLAFSEIDSLSLKCKFRDCSHQNEPGCAVRAALDNGELSKDRWDNYLKLKKEARYARTKEDVNMRIKEKNCIKKLNKSQRDLDKNKRFW